MEYEDRNDASNNRGNWNHLGIIQNISEQRTGKHEIKKLQKTNHGGHSTRTS
jgi:hypothetical protein